MIPSQKFGSDWPEHREHGAGVVVAGARAARRPATPMRHADTAPVRHHGGERELDRSPAARSDDDRQRGRAVLERLAEVAADHAARGRSPYWT